MIRRNPRRFAAIFVLTVTASNAWAARELSINPVAQSQNKWCWAACSEMVLNAYQYPTSQSTIAHWAVSGSNVPNDLKGSSFSVDQVLWHFGTISTNHTPFNPHTGGGNLSKSDVIWEIDQGRPIMAGLYRATTFHHLVLITGYTGTGSQSDVGDIIYLDPDPGQRLRRSYAEFVQFGFSQEWGETLRMASNPRAPIPTGVGPKHIVRLRDDDCTTEITQSPQSLSYRAYKYGDSPVSWEWNLVFPHEGGDVVVESWNTTTSQRDLTWSIPNFTLPGYAEWSYNFDGEIVGRIEVVCTDPDYHDDAINVVYVPGDLYPGTLIYEDQIVSSLQPDVRAHQVLIMRNDQFLPGCSINLKSGNRIDLRDGVTIEDGSLTNLIVDPALR